MFGYDKNIVQFALNTVTDSKDAIIGVLDRQVKYLQAELTRERRRADLAVDELLKMKQHASVMPERVHLPESPEAKERRDKMAAAQEALRNELEMVGDTGSHPDDSVDGKAPVTREELP